MNQSDMLAGILAVILLEKLYRQENNKNISDEINHFSKFDFTKLNHLTTNDVIEENIT